jgi:hypothetical protein
VEIKLNFINRSNDSNDLRIVIFQKNLATDFDERAVAWKVIQNCGQGDNHPFTFPMEMHVDASDSFGNYFHRFRARNGQRFSVKETDAGAVLMRDGRVGTGRRSREVEVVNGLPKGAINASIYRSQRVIATKTSIAPAQSARFEFEPVIWIGVITNSWIIEGECMNSAVLSEINTELSLLNIASADIVLTGGGPGSTSTPFQFSLENVVSALEKPPSEESNMPEHESFAWSEWFAVCTHCGAKVEVNASACMSGVSSKASCKRCSNYFWFRART